MGPVFPLTDFLSSAPFRTPYPVRRFVHLLVVYRRPLHGKDPRVGLSAPRRSISHAALARHCGGWGIPWPRALVPAETVDRGRRTVPAAALRGASIGHRQVIGHILGPPHTGRTHTFPSAPQHPLSPWHGGGGQRPPFAPGDLSVCPAGSCRPWRSCVLRKPGFTWGGGQPSPPPGGGRPHKFRAGNLISIGHKATRAAGGCSAAGVTPPLCLGSPRAGGQRGAGSHPPAVQELGYACRALLAICT